MMLINASVDRADDKLFESIQYNPHHVLNNVMPEETVCSYELRRRRHIRLLINKISFSCRLFDFIIRMIYKDMCYFVLFFYISHYVTLRYDKV